MVFWYLQQLLMNDGCKRKAQKYKNKTAFKLQFQPQAQEIHKKVSFKGLCKRCVEQMQWKIKFNKYKKMTEPARCNFCSQKNVLRSYMRVCQRCTNEKNVCPKCMEVETEEQVETKLNEREQKKEDAEAEKKMNDFLKTLKERSRRTVRRLYDKDKITWNNQDGNFIDENGEVLPLHFKQGYGKNEDNDDVDIFGDDDDEFEDEQEQEEEDEELQKINSKGKGKKVEAEDKDELKQPNQGQAEESDNQGQSKQEQNLSELGSDKPANSDEQNQQEQTTNVSKGM